MSKELSEREKWFKEEFKKLINGELCEICGVELTEEEKQETGDLCFKCAVELEIDIIKAGKHPDDMG